VAPEAPEITTQDEEAEGERSADVIVGGAESESDIPPAGSLARGSTCRRHFCRSQ